MIERTGRAAHSARAFASPSGRTGECSAKPGTSDHQIPLRTSPRRARHPLRTP